MANEEYLTDEYVAGLLSQEASDCSIKYSAMGVDAFLGKDSNSKKPSNIPKPNTRFLRNIIKGTDTHNKALLAKEAAESKARLKGLERAEETKRKKSNPSTKDIRERHMGAIQAILGGGKRRERDRENDDEKKSNSQGRDKAKRITRDHRSEDVSGGSDQELQHRSCASPNHPSDSSKHHRSRGADGRRSRHRDHSPDDGYQSRRHKSSRDDRSRSPRSGYRLQETKSRDTERRRHRHRSPARKKLGVSAGNESSLHDSQDEEIGPAPPPKIRGRGAVGALSGIERRFSVSYDPKTDMQGADEADG